MLINSPQLKEKVLENLSAFINSGLNQYASKRNYDYGQNNHYAVSQLSKYIKKRIISEQEVVEAILRDFSIEQAEKYIQEVCWRTYWKGWLNHHPQVWKNYLSDLNHLDVQKYKDALKVQGMSSKFECMNNWSKELQETGYLHNHSRMWFASIWIHTLQLPWQLGADFFMRHLLDGDEASNTLSWRWVAGLQTKGKSYLASENNICKFTEGRYESIEGLAKEPINLEYKDYGRTEFDLPKLPDTHKKYSLIIHSNDLSSVEHLIHHYNIESVYMLNIRDVHQSSFYSEKVIQFESTILREYEQKIKHSVSLAPAFLNDEIDLGQDAAFICWFPGQGYIQDYLEGKVNNLNYVYKEWDKNLFPFAKKGFFPFWKQTKKYIKKGQSSVE